MVVFHGCHVPLCVTNVKILMRRQILGLFKCLPTRFPVIVYVFTYIVEDPCDVVHVVSQLILGVESSCTTPTSDFQIRVVLLLMNLQLTGLFTFKTTLLSVLVDVITNMVEDPCDEVHVALQLPLVSESSDTTPTWDFQPRVVRLLMRRQIGRPFTRIPTLSPSFVDVVTYVMEDPIYEVHMVLQLTR